MDDQQLLNRGLERLTVLQADFSAGARSALKELLNRYRQEKEKLSAIVAEVDAALDCRECRGQCCQNGKYRLTVLDAVAAVSAGIPFTVDFSQKPLCPYGNRAGCLMEAGLRPADCVMFICDTIDRKLSPAARTAVISLERNVRECIREAAVLTGENMGTPLLLWAENKVTDSNSQV